MPVSRARVIPSDKSLAGKRFYNRETIAISNYEINQVVSSMQLKQGQKVVHKNVSQDCDI